MHCQTKLVHSWVLRWYYLMGHQNFGEIPYFIYRDTSILVDGDFIVFLYNEEVEMFIFTIWR